MAWTWKVIERVKNSHKVREHPRDAMLMELEVRLSDVPLQEWEDAFNHPPGHVTLGDGMKVSGVVVTVTIESKEQALDALGQIDRRIEIANSHIERNVLPDVRAREEQRKSQDAALAERLAAVDSALKGR